MSLARSVHQRRAAPDVTPPIQTTVLASLPSLVVGARAAARHGIGQAVDTSPWELWVVGEPRPAALQLVAGGEIARATPVDGHAVYRFDGGATPVWVRVMRADTAGALFVAANAGEAPLATPAGDLPCARLSSLLLIGRARLIDARGWWPRMQQFQRLRAAVPDESVSEPERAAYRALRREVEAELPPVHRTSMRVPNATFFGEFKHGDIRLYEHDDLHRTTCYYREPLYQSAKEDKTLAFIPRRSFERMSPLDRGRLVREECHAIALERVIIPAQALGIPCDAERAYFYALHRICTDLATGWFREFAIESFEQLARPDVDFTERFAHAVDTGSVRPRGDGTISTGQRRALRDCLARVAERQRLASLPGAA